MKTIKDIRTDDTLYAVFRLPESSSWKLSEVNIIEGFECGWTYIRQNMQNTLVGFVGPEIYINTTNEDSTFIDFRGVRFFTEYDEAVKFIREKIIKRSEEIQKEVMNLFSESFELVSSAKEEYGITSSKMNYSIYYCFKTPK